MRSDETQVDELLSVGRVSQRLACTTGLVYRLIASGDLPAVRLGAVGASLRVNGRELEGWLHSRDTRREPQLDGLPDLTSSPLSSRRRSAPNDRPLPGNARPSRRRR